MALLDRIKWDGMLNNAEWLVYRYPGEAFTTGSQLIVGEGQVAVFVKGGQALDYFTAGYIYALHGQHSTAVQRDQPAFWRQDAVYGGNLLY